MIRAAATLCLLGLASTSLAQSTKLVTVDGVLMVRKDQTVDVDQLLEDVDSATDKLSTLKAANPVFEGTDKYIAMLVKMNNEASLEIATSMAKVESDAAYNVAWADMVDDDIDSLSTQIKTEGDVISNMIKSKNSEFTGEVKKLETLATGELSKAKAAITKSVSDVLTEQAKSVAGLTKGYRDIRRHVFSGGDAGDGGRGGWRDFVISRTEIDTARPYFQLRTSTRFRALKAGVFHILFWSIQRGGRCHQHNRIRYAGGSWLHEHNHNWLTDGNWEGNTMNLYWKFNANKDFWTTHHNGCGVRWHSRPSNINDANAYNRFSSNTS